MSNYTNITYGGETLNLQSIQQVKRPSTVKQKMGARVVEIAIVGRSTQEFNLTVRGIIIADTEAALGTARAAIETLDDGEAHALVDGIHDGNYIIATESLSFDDNGDDVGLLYRYSMRLIKA